MQTGNVTTPFGRRSMTLGMLANQFASQEIEKGKSADKWQLFRALCEARVLIGVSDRALAVLNALLSFYPETRLDQAHGLVVFPSNAQLSIRAHGMAPATLRRHLADLVECGLILRKDSPNGKRYARKDKAGEIDQAFGLNLAPLLSRAEEIEECANRVRAEQHRLRITRERISLCRRDIAKLIETALGEGVQGDWQSTFLHFRGLIDGIGRRASQAELAGKLEDLEMLREEILNILEMQLKSRKTSANESHFERHIHNSNPQSISELEPLSEEKQGRDLKAAQGQGEEETSRSIHRDVRMPDAQGRAQDPTTRLRPAEPIRSFPLGMVLQACPQIADYGPAGAVSSWRDLMGAAVVVRSMLGVSPSAYQDACDMLGPENAATVMACILERAGHINSAGGYLRNLTERAKNGEFALGPMLMALMKANAGAGRKTG